MGMIILESPNGPITNRIEGDGHIVIGGSSGFGIDTEGKAFYETEGVIGSESAYAHIDPMTLNLELVRRSS
jgi:hypothetical protein